MPARPLWLIATLALLITLTGCATPLGVSRTWEDPRPLEGTLVVDQSADPRVEIRIDEDWVSTGALGGTVHWWVPSSRSFEVTEHQEVRYSGYNISSGFFGRSLILPLYLAFLAPLYATGPDYDGDGEKGGWDRVRYNIAMLNYFEAYPGGRTTEHRTRLAGRRTETREAPHDLCPGRPVELLLRVEAEGVSSSISRQTQDGTFSFEIPDLERYFTINPRATIIDRSSGLEHVVATFDQAHIADALWESGAFSDGRVTDDQKDIAIRLFEHEAGSQRTPPMRVVALYNRLDTLRNRNQGSPAVSPSRTQGKGMDIRQAQEEGRILVSGSGVNLFGVSLRLENLTDRNLSIFVPPGTLLDCEGAAQNMVLLEATTMELSPRSKGGSASRQVAAACANMHRKTPGAADSFRLGKAPDPRLTELAPYLVGVDKTVRQAAVWIITDDATLRNFSSYTFPRIGRGEVLKAIALILRAGINIEDRKIWKWYTSE